jgi:hypothetical protein
MVSLGDFIDEHYKPTVRPSAEPSSSGRGSYESNGGSVFDRFSEAASWADILQPLGWIQVKPGDSATLAVAASHRHTSHICARTQKSAIRDRQLVREQGPTRRCKPRAHESQDVRAPQLRRRPIRGRQSTRQR